MTSEEAAKEFEDQSLDMGFLDANHTYESAKQDIKLWTPKVKIGGLFVFHDYGGRYRGIMKAVNKAFGRGNLLLRGNRVCGVIIK